MADDKEVLHKIYSLEEMEERADRLYELANACNGQNWVVGSQAIDAYLRYINDPETFPGRDIKLLLIEVHRLRGILYDGVQANVFADWLEEQGETKAATLLRREFPIHQHVPTTILWNG